MKTKYMHKHTDAVITVYRSDLDSNGKVIYKFRDRKGGVAGWISKSVLDEGFKPIKKRVKFSRKQKHKVKYDY